MTKPQVMIMAGGTGGHIYPALSVALRLREQGCELSWLGSVGGLEERIVPASDIHLDLLPISGIRGKGLIALVIAPFRLVQCVFKAISIIRKKKIELVVGFGGFASGPGGIAALLTKTPLLIHEQNAIAGLTNRILSYFANRVCQAFENTFRESYRVKTTGNPIRESIVNVGTQTSFTTRPLHILIIGGSRGAKVFNDKLPVLLRELIKDRNILVWHQTGANNDVAVKQEYAALDCESVRVQDFIDDMDAAYQWAHVVICRAGALTVSEIATIKKLAIFIPYPHAVDDHQAANALTLVSNDAAFMLRQEKLDDVENIINQLLDQPDTIAQMTERLDLLSHALATSKIAIECNQLMGISDE